LLGLISKGIILISINKVFKNFPQQLKHRDALEPMRNFLDSWPTWSAYVECFR